MNEAKYFAFCIGCSYGWEEEFYEEDFPRLRSEHSRRCNVNGHPVCKASDIKFRPAFSAPMDEARKAQWRRMSEEADAQEMYVAMLIQQDQWRRTEDELMAKRPRLVRTILKIRNSLK